MKRNGRTATTHWQDERDWAYSDAVYPKLARRYPNRWVALAHHRVIAAGTNVMKVVAQARRKIDWEEIPLVFVERGIHVYLLHGHSP
jgi:hypothetical protein